MIPRTLLRKKDGGDGTALDVMLIGPAVPRGSTVRARSIGVIRVIDRGEQDDKILAVTHGPTMKGVYDVESLRLRYPGAAEIIGTWWAHAHLLLSSSYASVSRTILSSSRPRCITSAAR